MSSYVPAWIKSNPERFPRAEVDGRPPRRGAVGVRAHQRPGRRARVQRADALSARRRRPRPHRDHGAGRERGRDDRRGRRPQRPRRRRRSPRRCRRSCSRASPARPRAPGSRCSGAGRPRKRCSWRGTTPRTSETVARAGKAAYPLPMLTNAALNRPGKKPGQYPSGGPLPHLFEAWKAGAPSLDLLAPDIYLPDFVAWCDRYQRPGNPLFIPEAKNDADAAVHALYAIGRGALGFSPFAIESAGDADAAALTKAYVALTELGPVLAAAGAGQDGRRAVRQGAPDRDAALRRSRAGVSHDYTFEWASPARHDPVWPRARRPDRPDRARRIHRHGQRHHRHVRGGERASTSGSSASTKGRVANGTFVVTRRLNGDETHQGRHLRLPMGASAAAREALPLQVKAAPHRPLSRYAGVMATRPSPLTRSRGT